MSRLLVAFLLTTLAGCDTSGIHPIGTELDPTAACPLGYATSTWVRSMTDGSGEILGVEVLLLGWRPDDPIDQGLDTLLETTPRCMARFKIWGSTTTEEHLGTVALDGAGGGVMTENLHCSFPMEPEQNIVRRRGSQCLNLEELELTEETVFSFSMDGDVLEIDFPEEGPLLDFDRDPDDGYAPYAAEFDFRLPAATYRYAKIGSLAEALAADPESDVASESIWRLYHLGLLTSEGRLKGFGSGGMSAYTTPGNFVGLISSGFHVNVELNQFAKETITDIVYPELEDLSGMIIGSPEASYQTTVVNFGGNGGMRNGLDFELRVNPDDNAGALRGHVSYANTEVNNGIGNGGTFGLTVEGSSYDEVPRELSVQEMMGYDLMVPGFGNYKFDPSVLDPNL